MVDQSPSAVLSIAARYLERLRQHRVQFESAWLFGSCARGTATNDSDIDIALVMKDVGSKFLKEVELTRYRRAVDLRIEPHIIPADEIEAPFGAEIIRTGIKIG